MLDFTVVIPSRNRPVLLRTALLSVLEQSHQSVEVIVVNDGSNGENVKSYAELEREFTPRVRFVQLEMTKNGHGQSYAINRGVEAAESQFVCFLDDDDYWIDNAHLAHAKQALANDQVDVYLTNQEAFRGVSKVDGPIWLEGLDAIIDTHGGKDVDGYYTATIADLVACRGFGHLNTTVVRRSLYLQMGGMDENIRYECDWDFFLRLVDAARRIRFSPGFTSHHNAPDPSKALNMSTAVNMLQKMLFRTYVLDKAMLFAQSTVIRKHASQHKIYTLKRIAQLLADESRYRDAYIYARQAGIHLLDLKWQIYSALLYVKALATSK